MFTKITIAGQDGEFIHYNGSATDLANIMATAMIASEDIPGVLGLPSKAGSRSLDTLEEKWTVTKKVIDQAQSAEPSDSVKQLLFGKEPGTGYFSQLGKILEQICETTLATLTNQEPENFSDELIEKLASEEARWVMAQHLHGNEMAFKDYFADFLVSEEDMKEALQKAIENGVDAGAAAAAQTITSNDEAQDPIEEAAKEIQPTTAQKQSMERLFGNLYQDSVMFQQLGLMFMQRASAIAKTIVTESQVLGVDISGIQTQMDALSALSEADASQFTAQLAPAEQPVEEAEKA